MIIKAAVAGRESVSCDGSVTRCVLFNLTPHVVLHVCLTKLVHVSCSIDPFLWAWPLPQCTK